MLIGKHALQKQLFGKEHAYGRALKKRHSNIRLKDVTPVFDDTRLVKSDYELQQLRSAIDITGEAHRKVMNTVQPGIYEYQLDGLIYNTYRRYGAHSGFPSIVGSGPNATTLHYEENARQIERMLLLESNTPARSLGSERDGKGLRPFLPPVRRGD